MGLKLVVWKEAIKPINFKQLTSSGPYSNHDQKMSHYTLEKLVPGHWKKIQNKVSKVKIGRNSCLDAVRDIPILLLFLR